jgi:hypothetical protein
MKRGAMAEIEVSGDWLVVHVTGVERTLALKSLLEFPLEHVVGVSRGIGEDDERGWLKLVGTHVPGVVRAGTFHSNGRRVFWDVRDRDRAIAIELRDERYARLVIQVLDPDATLEAILEAIGQSPASRHPSAFRRDMAGDVR